MRVEKRMGTVAAHQKAAPVETIALAEDLGVSVYYVDWPDSMSGKIERDPQRGGKSGYAIFVNGNHHPNRRRFTIAHELAHLILHEEEIGDGIFDDALYRSGLPRRMEVEANRLAADILMPWHLLNAAMDGGDYSVEELAASFGVSNSSMSIRLAVPYDL